MFESWDFEAQWDFKFGFGFDFVLANRVRLNLVPLKVPGTVIDFDVDRDLSIELGLSFQVSQRLILSYLSLC
jgi:hypothetical protein